MKALPYSKEAYRLFHEGALTFAKVEANGMCIDMDYLEKAMKKTAKQIKRLQEDLASSEVMKVWRQRFRTKTNFNSNDQLGKVLFETMGFECPEMTAKNKYKTDEKTLGTVDHPFVRDYLEIKKLQKALGTYLTSIHREVVDGLLHPSFNLHLVKTFRSSSDSPNFQNIPVRVEKIKRLIRRAFIARKNRRLIEIDYGGIEVKVAACYHKDPTMLRYIKDPTTDMHRDMAMECYMLPEKEVTSNIRYCGKNMFVFPEFYGAYWLDCAAALWQACETLKLETTSGMPLRKHLKKMGIKGLGDQQRKGSPRPGTFERHIQKVEKNFWTKRFGVYAQWKKDWYDDYKKNGWFISKTGFISQGHMVKNKVINYAVQGDAFHCLLQAMIWLQRAIEKRKMKTLLIGQIHDSILADVPVEEVDDFLAMSKKIMIKKLTKEWKWIIVPLTVDAEMTPVGGSWYEKKEVEI